MGKPINFPKPDLSRLATRQIKLPNSRVGLEGDLYEWISQIAAKTRQPPERGVDAATVLMSTAKDSIDVLMQAPGSMALGDTGGKRKVHVYLNWARFANGEWYIRDVAFGLDDVTDAQWHRAQQSATKERLLDKAELENSRHLHLRKIVFPAESHQESWPDDVIAGDRLVWGAVDFASTHAKKDAAMLENPVGPEDMFWDLVGAGVGHVKGPADPFGVNKRLEKTAVDWFDDAGKYHFGAEFGEDAFEGAKKLAEWYERVEYVKDAKSIAHELGEKEKSRGDKILGLALEGASKLPGAGPFVKTLAGEFFNIAIASDAARITKIRSRFYIWFVVGYIGELTMYDTGSPKHDASHGKPGALWYYWDMKYYNLGRSLVAPSQRFYPQASLLHYASEHYTAGGWSGWSFKSHNWKTIDDYIVNWSPELLAHALATQLHTLHNLTD